MERPFALWAILLAILPWLALLRSRPRDVERVLFPALVLIASRQSRKRRARRSFLRSALRSLALVALAILWASPTLHNDAPDSSETSLDAVRELTSILVVDGANESDATPGGVSSARILELALNAQLDKAKTERVAAVEFALRPDALLDGRDAVLVADVAALTDREETALEQFARRGGAVVIWPGFETDATRWNKTLQRWRVAAKVVDAPFENAPAAPRSAEERVFFKAFPGAETACLDALPAERAFCCVGDDVAPILRDRKTRAPVFVRLSNGVYWFALSPDPRLGALAAAPTFPTLVESTTRYPLDAARETAAPHVDGLVSARRAVDVALWLVLFVATLVEIAPSRRRPLRARALKEARGVV